MNIRKRMLTLVFDSITLLLSFTMAAFFPRVINEDARRTNPAGISLALVVFMDGGRNGF
jgi:hypothetical protein